MRCERRGEAQYREQKKKLQGKSHFLIGVGLPDREVDERDSERRLPGSLRITEHRQDEPRQHETKE
jgi:hypothetical protein